MSRIIESAMDYLGEAMSPRAPSHQPRIRSSAVGRLSRRLGISESDALNACGISEGEFQNRKRKRERLTEVESDGVLRVARVAIEAERVFANNEKAHRWLLSKSIVLAARPLELLGTDAGAREVEFELVRIDSGDFV
jgi:putative toxin-antitoxin system antitoxin component (TIGR02293 family)